MESKEESNEQKQRLLEQILGPENATDVVRISQTVLSTAAQSAEYPMTELRRLNLLVSCLAGL